MRFTLEPMGQSEATAIAGWHYDPPYSFYDWSVDNDDAALLLGEETREGRFFTVFDERNTLVGFLEFQVKGDDVVVGLGLRPDLTGRG